MKLFPKITLSIIIAFNIWFALSYIEVVAKNLEGAPLMFWNIFQLSIN